MIVNPTTGLLIYHLVDQSVYQYNGQKWISLNAPNNIIIDADKDTYVRIDEENDTDEIRFYLEDTLHMELDKSHLGLHHGISNLSIGRNSGTFDNLQDNRNTNLGTDAGRYNVSGVRNVNIGTLAGSSCDTCDNNSYVGYAAGSNAFGSENTYIGRAAGRYSTTGSQNTFIGKGAGQNATGSGNVFIGRDAGRNEPSENKLYISNSSTSEPLIYGDFTTGEVTINSKLIVEHEGLSASNAGFFSSYSSTGESVALRAVSQAENTTLESVAVWGRGEGENGIGVIGQGKLGVASIGNLGIISDEGSSPRIILQLADGVSTLVELDSSTNQLRLGDIDGKNNDVSLYGNGSERITLKNDGKVGIGTTNPLGPFHSRGDVYFESDGSHLDLYAVDAAGTSMRWLSLNNTTNDLHLGGLDDNGGSVILSAGGSDRILINNSGNVGVGTNTPEQKLHVKGDTFFESNGGHLDLRARTSDGTETRWFSFSNTTKDIFLGDLDDAGGDLILRSGGTDRIRVLNNGNVGIGTANPNFQLELNLDSAAKPNGGMWSAVSDQRLKQNIERYEDGLDKILEINPVTFQYNAASGYDTETSHVGVIAQEIRDIAPYMVAQNKNEYLHVNSTPVMYMLVNAVKSLHKKLLLQEEKTEELELLLFKLSKEEETYQMLQSLKARVERLENIETQVETTNND
jgi:hypothetical protein